MRSGDRSQCRSRSIGDMPAVLLRQYSLHHIVCCCVAETGDDDNSRPCSVLVSRPLCADGVLWALLLPRPRRICDICDFFAPHINVLTYLLAYVTSMVMYAAFSDLSVTSDIHVDLVASCQLTCHRSCSSLHNMPDSVSIVGQFYLRVDQMTDARRPTYRTIWIAAIYRWAPWTTIWALETNSQFHAIDIRSTCGSCPPITPRYCRGTLVCFSWSETLEQSSGRYYYVTITTSVSKKTENLPISAVIPGHYTVVSDCLRHGGPSRYFLL